MSDELSIIIKGGTVVTSQGMSRSDVGISGEKVVKIAPEIDEGTGGKVIDATNRYVLPGLIDPHTHPVYVDDMGGLSVTAAFGGMTTLIHYAYIKPGMELMPTLQKFRDDGSEKSVLDFGLHLGLFDVENQIADLPAAIKFGATSFKVFLTYAKLKWMTDDYWLTAVMDVAAQERCLAMVHAENGLATDYLEDKFNREGADPLEKFTAVRPDVLEAEAVNRALSLAHVMGSALYIVHNSAGACLEPLRRAREKGWPVIGETCPQYLTLTHDDTTKRYGAQAKVGPPLRTKEDNEDLWGGLADGTLQTVGSDHAPKPKKVDDDFFKAPYGAPQTETSFRMIYHEGVNGGRITLPRLVEVMSENPARVFGFYPQKGTIQVGSDADIVVFDPNRRQVISASNQHSNVDFTLYEGREVVGVPVLTMQRGRVIIDGDELVAKPGQGQFLPTSTSHLYDEIV